LTPKAKYIIIVSTGNQKNIYKKKEKFKGDIHISDPTINEKKKKKGINFVPFDTQSIM